MKTLGEYTEEDFSRQTPLGLLLKVVAVVIGLALLFGVVGFFGGWFSEAKRQISPTNVKAQWQFAYDYDRSLDAIARQWCTASKQEGVETDPQIKSSRTNQRIAIENNYQRVEAVYDARLADAFRTKYIRPHDVPAQAPSLQENVQQNC